MRRGEGSARTGSAALERRLARARRRGTSATAFWRSSVANSSGELLGRDRVGALDPAVEIGADDPLRRRVGLGRAARRAAAANRIPFSCTVVVGDDPVDHAPALERRRRRRGRRSSRTRAPAPGPARSAIRWVPPAPGVSPTTASTSPNFADSLGPDHVAAERDLEPGGQAEAVDQRQGRDLERLEPLDAVDQRPGERARLPRRPASTIRWKALTSTPPVKMSPSARQTSARASEPSTSSRQSIELVEGVVGEQVERRVSRARSTATPRRARA